MPRAGVITSSPHGGGAVNATASASWVDMLSDSTTSRSAATRRSLAAPASSPIPYTATITFSPASSMITSCSLAQEARQLVAARARAAHVDRQAQRVVVEDARRARQPLVQHVQPGDRPHRLARARQRAQRLVEQLVPARGGAAAGSVEGGEQESVRARGLDHRHAAVHHLLLDQVPMPQVDHRRLREAADDLVGARDDEVGSEAEGVRRAAPRGREGARPTPRPPRAARRGRAPPPRAPRCPRPRRSTWARRPWRPPPPASPAASGRAPRGSCSERCEARGRARAPRRSGAGPT